MRFTQGQIIPVYEVVENEQDEDCVIGRQYPKNGNYHDCISFANFPSCTQFYMYEDEVKLVYYLRVKSVK